MWFRKASARRLVLLFLFVGGTVSAPPAHGALATGDRDALIAIDSATGGVLGNSGGWNGAPGTECNGSWVGVECGDVEGEERVRLLKLGRHQIPFTLQGSLPPLIGNLTELTQLELTDQSLAGPLPAELSALVEMTRLDLRRNRFGGSLEPVMAMRRLQYLNLEGNSLGGRIPDLIGGLTQLTNLELTGNVLTGNIPSEIGKLTLLQKLWLDANRLQGVIPAEIGNLRSLLELRLGGNDLVGEIPASIGDLTSLTILQIGLCRLSGPLPAELANLGRLVELSLGTNRLTGGLGAIDWSQMAQLQRIYLDNNALEDEIPASVLQLGELTELRLQGNKLTGTVPDAVLDPGFTASVDLRWNALRAEHAVAGRLDRSSPGHFSVTQTVAPTGVRVLVTSDHSIRLMWNAVAFQSGGGYRITYHRPEVSGDTPARLDVPGKAVTTAEIAGLEAGQPYSFVVESFTDSHAANSNSLTSRDGTAVTGITALGDQRGQAVFTTSTASSAEGRILRLQVTRAGGISEPLRLGLEVRAGAAPAATPGEDLQLDTTSVEWADQEGGSKEIAISILADARTEPIEHAQVLLQAMPPQLVGDPAVVDIEILDRAIAAEVDSPVVAQTGDGLELSVWTVVRPGRADRDIAGRFTAGRSPDTIPFEFVITDTERDEHDPLLLPVGDTFLVSWLQGEGSERRRVRYCEIDRRIGRCKKKTLVANASVSEYSAVADEEGIWLTWRVNSGLRLARFDRGGRIVGRRERVTNDRTAEQPRVAGLAGGGVFVTWTARVLQVPGDLTTARATLRGRGFDPTIGFRPVVSDLAGADAVELRDIELKNRSDGTLLLAWVGVNLGDSPSGPVREGPQLHVRRLTAAGQLLTGEAVLGCPTCGELVQAHSILSDPVDGSCVATWVAIPAGGTGAPLIWQAELTECAAVASQLQLELRGPAFRPRQVELGSAGGRILVLGQRTARASLDLRSYRCTGGSTCRN